MKPSEVIALQKERGVKIGDLSSSICQELQHLPFLSIS